MLLILNSTRATATLSVADAEIVIYERILTVAPPKGEVMETIGDTVSEGLRVGMGEGVGVLVGIGVSVAVGKGANVGVGVIDTEEVGAGLT